jgi:hypothetical protein
VRWEWRTECHGGVPHTSVMSQCMRAELSLPLLAIAAQLHEVAYSGYARLTICSDSGLRMPTTHRTSCETATSNTSQRSVQ